MDKKPPHILLQDYRWRNRLQVGELADMVGLSISHTSLILSGVRYPGPDAARAIKEKTGIRFPIAKGKRRPFDTETEAIG